MAPLELDLLINGERVAGQGEVLEVENPFKHVHIETEIAPKDWWYPYEA